MALIDHTNYSTTLKQSTNTRGSSPNGNNGSFFFGAIETILGEGKKYFSKDKINIFTASKFENVFISRRKL